jgi:aminoglycoside phosphotransferase family enzyme/predicted kinase
VAGERETSRIMTSHAQTETIAFLSRGEAYGEPGAKIERIETHISIVFLVGDRAFKLKRARAFSYLDFSTPEKRRKNCEAELRLGRMMAPGLYRSVRAVTRNRDGILVLDGKGEAIDWLIEMRRFDQDALFDHLAVRGGLTPSLMRDLADAIAAFHETAEKTPQWGGPDAVHIVLRDIVGNLKSFPQIFAPAEAGNLAAQFEAQFGTNRALIEQRNRAGKVRRCHGDLHLRNICLFDGKPTLFDPIEFNDAISSVDVLYDLAFLLMDLIHRGHGEFANLVFNRYLDISGEGGGLALMPLYLAMRAAIRAHVSASAGEVERAKSYFDLSGELLQPKPTVLVAIGGVSGTGKTTLAQALAPDLGCAPGARILRSDVIRKRLHGITPETRLPDSAYGSETTSRVYDALCRDAAAALVPGRAVIADAAFLSAEERAAIAATARMVRVPFSGLWLEAPADVLEQRLVDRRDDASDADVTVLRRQLEQDFGAVDWHHLEATGDAAGEARAARALIAER